MERVEKVYYNLGKKLKAVRKAKGLSQEDMAKVLMFNKISLSKLENGHGRMPLHDAVWAAKKFKLSLDDL